MKKVQDYHQVEYLSQNQKSDPHISHLNYSPSLSPSVYNGCLGASDISKTLLDSKLGSSRLSPPSIQPTENFLYIHHLPFEQYLHQNLHSCYVHLTILQYEVR